MRSSDLTEQIRAQMIYANILQQRQQLLEKDQISINYQGGGTDAFVTIMLAQGALYTTLENQRSIIANSITIKPIAPSLTTTSVTDNADGTATAVGTVTSEGTADVTARGFVWAATSLPTLADSSLAHESGGIGEYTDVLATGAGTFYVSAYATNSVGTTYGDSIEITVTS